MGFVSRLKGLFGVTMGTQSHLESAEVTRFMFGLRLEDQGMLTDPYRQHPTVRTGIRAKADAAAGIELEFFGKGEDALTEHPVQQIWKRPNPYMTGRQLFRMTYLHLFRDGVAYWYYPDLEVGRGIARSGSIEVLPPARVKFDWKDGAPVWLYRGPGGAEARLNEERLTIFRDADPDNPWVGLSPLEAVRLDADADYAAARWNAAFFRQGAIPAGLIKFAEFTIMTREQREELSRTFSDEHVGKRRVGVLPPGAEFEDLGQGHRDMEFHALREYARENILAVLGVPPFVAGVLDKANYANAREQSSLFWRHTIVPAVEDVAATINDDFLVKMAVAERVFPKWEGLAALIADTEKKSEIAKRYFDMGVPLRHANERLGLGLDPEEIPGSDTGYLPMNLVPADLLGMPLEFPAEPEEEAAAAAGRGAPVTARASMAGRNEGRRSMVWRALALRSLDLEIRFAKVVRSHFHALEREALGHLAGLRGWRWRNGRTKQDEDFFLFDIAEADRQIRKVTAPLYEAAVRRGGATVIAELSLETVFSLLDPKVIALLGSRSFRIKGINDTLAKQLRETLAEAATVGETIDQVRDRVKAVFERGLVRSRTIARTEMPSAFNEARFLAMRDNSVSRHEWLSSRDERVRDSHMEIDGDVVAMGEHFDNGLAYPLDPAGPVEEVANCRCVTVAVIDDAA